MWIHAATAAPTYFEPVQIQIDGPSDYYALIDGAVFACNPGMCAYVHALERFPEAEDILMVSLGTGELTRLLGSALNATISGPRALAPSWSIPD